MVQLLLKKLLPLNQILDLEVDVFWLYGTVSKRCAFLFHEEDYRFVMMIYQLECVYTP